MIIFKNISFKIIFWALIPFLFVVSIVPFISHLIIKNSALDVVKKRDAAFAELAGVRLAENLQRYTYFLQTIADSPACESMSFTHMDPLLTQARTRLHFFDGGIFIFNDSANAVWTYPLVIPGTGYSFPSTAHFEALKKNLRPVFSDIFYHDFLKTDAILIAVPILDKDSQFLGMVAGICSVQFSTLGTTYTKVLEFKSGKSSFGYLVDGNGRVLYHRHSSLLGKRLMDQEAVQKVVQGFTGASFSQTPSGIKLISGFAPVPGTAWGVVTQGNWTDIEQLILFYIRLFTGILWAGGGISAGLMFFFIKRTLNPIKDLTRGANSIAHGDFTEITIKKTGDEIETLSRQFNSMARALKASFANIKSRVEALDKAQTALKESEEKITGIINSVADAMMMIHENGDVVWLNDKGKDLFGDLAHTKKYFELLYPGKKHPGGCIVKSCFLTGIESDNELKIPVNGKTMDFWCTSNVVQRAREGTPRRVVLVCRNLAEKKRMRQEVLRNAQLAALGELAAGVAHEINNPINGIINYAQIIEDTRGTAQEDLELPQRIIAEGMRIANIVSKLLSFARSGSEEKIPVSIPDIIDDVLELTRTMVKKDHIKIRREISHYVPPCNAVVHQIQQIFLNVIGNARYALNQKFGDALNEKELIISCDAVISDGEKTVRTTFTDNGSGIPQGIMDKLCNPFFSTKPADHGTGLGLSISYGIIEEHRGDLNIESVEGQWTKVIIDLPLHETKTEDHQSIGHSGEGSGPGYDHPQKTHILNGNNHD